MPKNRLALMFALALVIEATCSLPVFAGLALKLPIEKTQGDILLIEVTNIVSKGDYDAGRPIVYMGTTIECLRGKTWEKFQSIKIERSIKVLNGRCCNVTNYSVAPLPHDGEKLLVSVSAQRDGKCLELSNLTYSEERMARVKAALQTELEHSKATQEFK